MEENETGYICVVYFLQKNNVILTNCLYKTDCARSQHKNKCYLCKQRLGNSSDERVRLYPGTCQ